MGSKFKQAGLVLVGVLAGVMLSLNFSAVAQREAAKFPLPVDELRAFAEVFGSIKANYVETVEDKKLITEAINGMLTGLDPHSAYLDQEAFKELQVGTQGEFGGLGIEVGMEDGFVKVVSPIEDTPAFRAGLKPGDLIIKLDDTPVKGMNLNDAVKRMRGKPKSTIRLTILRKGESKPFEVSIVRDVIRVQSVKSKMLEPGYGYVRVSQFQEHTGENLVKAINGLYKDGPLKGLVLDLRNDPGGLLNGAVGISAAFLPPQVDGGLDRRPHRGRQAEVRREPRGLPARHARRLSPQPARGDQDGADGGAGERRLGVGVRDRRRRAAGLQARDGDRHADLRQGLGADDHAARQQHGDQAHDGALLHAAGPLDPGEGHHARTSSSRSRARPRAGSARPTSTSTSRTTATPRPRRRQRRKRRTPRRRRRPRRPTRRTTSRSSSAGRTTSSSSRR